MNKTISNHRFGFAGAIKKIFCRTSVDPAKKTGPYLEYNKWYNADEIKKISALDGHSFLVHLHRRYGPQEHNLKAAVWVFSRPSLAHKKGILGWVNHSDQNGTLMWGHQDIVSFMLVDLTAAKKIRGVK